MRRLISLLLIFALLVLPAASAEEPAAWATPLWLSGNPSTGFVWTASSSDEAVASVIDEGFLSSDQTGTQTGAPGVFQLSIGGQSAGTAAVTFTYSRPWESVEPEMQFTLPVRVDEDGSTFIMHEFALPCDAETGWAFSMEEGILEITDSGYTEGLGQSFSLVPLTDGIETVTFTHFDADGLVLGVFVFYVVCEHDEASVFAVEYLNDLPAEDGSAAPGLTFSSLDFQNEPVTEQIFEGYSLTILNFWEPWCGPCVGEMPSLQKLSTEYADRGVQVVGVFATPGDAEIQAILDRTGVTYPILRYTREFDFLQTGYVPTTVMIDGSGTIVYGPFAGAMDYDSWCALVEELL